MMFRMSTHSVCKVVVIHSNTMHCWLCYTVVIHVMRRIDSIKTSCVSKQLTLVWVNYVSCVIYLHHNKCVCSLGELFSLLPHVFQHVCETESVCQLLTFLCDLCWCDIGTRLRNSMQRTQSSWLAPFRARMKSGVCMREKERGRHKSVYGECTGLNLVLLLSSRSLRRSWEKMRSGYCHCSPPVAWNVHDSSHDLLTIRTGKHWSVAHAVGSETLWGCTQVS